VLKLLSALSWKDAAIGAGAAIVLGSVGRPLIVSTVSLGITTWKEVVAEAQKIKTDAIALEAKAQADAGTISNVLAELKELRAQVASVNKAQQAA
jgi:hypothetical protein